MADYSILVPPPRRRGPLLIGLVVAVLVASVGVVAFMAGRHNTGNHHAGGAVVPPTTVPAKALTVVSTVPAAGATEVPSDQVVSVKFSSAVSGGGGMPTLTPPIAGTWKRVGSTTFVFSAGAPLIPTSSETLTVPAGETGPRSTSGAVLTTPVSASFTVAQASTERLQQLLGQLNYLPLSFTPTSSLSSPNEAATAQSGNFAWRWPGTTASLTSLWTEGSENLITKGAVMNFENQHGLKVDGLAGSRVWSALLADTATARVNVDAYNYVFVSKQIPENLTLFSNGAPVLANIAVNTGAPGADTTDGTYPVFEHVTSSRMQGTNPDGSTYDDPNVPWASYFNGGDALHGFVRATYGTPQSNGCVEMPIADAARVWPLTPLGTLVTVAGPSS